MSVIQFYPSVECQRYPVAEVDTNTDIFSDNPPFEAVVVMGHVCLLHRRGCKTFVWVPKLEMRLLPVGNPAFI